MKRLISLVVCLMLVMSLATTAFAEENPSIVITGTAPGHTYEAYQIFTGDVSGNVLSNVEWGTGVGKDNGAALITALTSDTHLITNSLDPTHQGTTMSAQLSGVTNAATLAEKMQSWGPNLDRIDYFAYFLKYGSKVPGSPSTSYLTNVKTDSEYVSGNEYHFHGLTPGYYMIIDTTETDLGVSDYYSKFMVYVVGGEPVSITVKGFSPAGQRLQRTYQRSV